MKIVKYSLRKQEEAERGFLFEKDTLIDRLEELEDIEGLKKLRKEPVRSLKKILKIGHRKDVYR